LTYILGNKTVILHDLSYEYMGPSWPWSYSNWIYN